MRFTEDSLIWIEKSDESNLKKNTKRNHQGIKKQVVDKPIDTKTRHFDLRSLSFKQSILRHFLFK